MPPPGPPCRKTSGLPRGLPYSSKWIVCSFETFRYPERYGFVLGKRSRRPFAVDFIPQNTTHAWLRRSGYRNVDPGVIRAAFRDPPTSARMPRALPPFDGTRGDGA